MRILIAFALWVGMAVATQAQTWQARPYNDEGFFGATTSIGFDGLTFACGGPIPTNSQPQNTLPTRPYQLTLEMRFTGLGTAGPPRNGMILVLDEIGYALPPAVWDATYAVWSLRLSMTDPAILDAMDGATVRLWDGAQYLLDDPGTNLGPALQDSMRFCVETRAGYGQAVPPEVSALLFQPAAALSGPEARMDATLRSDCGGGYRLEPEAVTRTNLDGDGIPDLAVFYGGLTCNAHPFGSNFAAGYCGASQCRALVFVSSSSALGPDFDVFTPSVIVDPARPGQLGIAVRMGACQDLGLMPNCVLWHRWTGRDLIRVQ